jgi:hypothetical protein
MKMSDLLFASCNFVRTPATWKSKLLETNTEMQSLLADVTALLSVVSRRFSRKPPPPTIAVSATFTEMQKSAKCLTQSIGYVGAGTIGYLYNAATDDYFFLELNPRLQVEHPSYNQSKESLVSIYLLHPASSCNGDPLVQHPSNPSTLRKGGYLALIYCGPMVLDASIRERDQGRLRLDLSILVNYLINFSMEMRNNRKAKAY